MSVLQHSSKAYSLLAKCFHWLTVLLVFGLFGLGLWMGQLTYYDAWYREAPALHMSFGVVLFILVVLRLVYRATSQYPKPIPEHKPYEHKLASLMHIVLYGALVCMFFTGFFIATANGDPLIVFETLAIPALITLENYEDQLGELHEWLAYIIMGLVALHAGAALKHHFVDKDGTLLRMITRSKN